MIPGIGFVGSIDGSPYQVYLADAGNSEVNSDYCAVIFRIQVSRTPGEGGLIAFDFKADKDIGDYYSSTIYAAGQTWHSSIGIPTGNQLVEHYLIFKKPTEPVNITIELFTSSERFIVVEPKTCTITITP
jgi:hypothetical protein